MPHVAPAAGTIFFLIKHKTEYTEEVKTGEIKMLGSKLFKL